MSRAALCLVLGAVFSCCLAALPAAAGNTGFGTATAASVWGAALSYIAPRALMQVSVPQMTIWGLNGLTALDPDLTASLADGEIQLYGPNSMLFAVPAPAPADTAGWGDAAARIAAAAYAASPALQQAGTQTIIDNFFDEMFNHFDPYSRYEAPLQAAQDQLMITGLAGAGFTLGRQGNMVVIATVAADGPAAEAGLVPGCQVLRIDGRAVHPGALTALNDSLNGIAGSDLRLSVLEPGDTVPAELTITRTFIPPQTVFALRMDHPSPQIIGLSIASFNEGTSENFSAALVAALVAQPNATTLVLDLRGNRGGILRQAVLVADSLMPSGPIAETEGRDPAADQNFTAEGADLTNGLQLLVLVDGQTASAAEILAAALADNRRAVVIGSETLGKGLVQTVTALPDSGELFVTWSRVLAPRGWPLQALGVMPQVCTSLGPQALAVELKALKSGKNLMLPALEEARAARAPLPIDQILAIRNACPAEIGGDLDLQAAAALAADPTAYQAALLP